MWIPFRINGRELDWTILPDMPNRRLVIRSRLGDFALEATIESGLWGGLWLRSPRLPGTEFPLGQRAPFPPPEFSERHVPYLHTELVRSLIERWAHRKSYRIKPRDSTRLARKTVPRDVIITSEQDWIGTNDIHAMLRVFQENASARKWRLFAVASCRRIRHLMNDTGGHALDLAERFADDDDVSIEELKTALKEIAAAQPAAYGDRKNVALSWALSAATTAADPEPRRYSCLNFADARHAAGEHEYAQFGPHRKHRARIVVQREERAQAPIDP